MRKHVVPTGRTRLARERGAVRKDWGGRIPVVLVYPNLYAVGMANLGFLTVYSLLNRHEDVVCERAFLPDPEEREAWTRGVGRLVSLETGRPLEDFSFAAFSLSYENDYPHVAAILGLAGIPALRRKRSRAHPYVMAGGPAAFLNPEPLAEIVDFFVLGEAEQVLDEFLCIVRGQRDTADREEFLEALLQVEGIYVPAFYQPRYRPDGSLASFRPERGAPARIKRRWVRNLDEHPAVSTVFTPDTELPGIYLVEVGRGCPRRCRFCATGSIYHPSRYRSPEALQPSLLKGMEGDQRLGLVCASLGDYPGLEDVCRRILEAGGALSAPSIRLDRLPDSLLAAMKKSGQRTLTLAPEAGSERLRRVLNKPFTDEALLEAVERLAAHGLFGVRLYFMVGLPGESDEDVDAIIELAKRVRHRFLRAARRTARMGEVTLSVNPFVPKPWSAFQWCAMTAEDLLKERLHRIRRALQKEPNIVVTHGLAKWAYLHALFSRGDRRVHRFILAGADPETNWKRLFRDSSLNPDFFVYRERDREELFPWDFLDHGISKEGLYREYRRGTACWKPGAPPK